MTTPEVEATEDVSRGWRRLVEPEMLVALSAVVLGLCALVVSLVQVQIMRQEQHANVWPVLQIGRTYSTGQSVGIIALNPGIGPAVVRDVRVTVDGLPVTSWPEAVSAMVPTERPSNLRRSALSRRIVRGGESIQTLLINDPNLADAVRENMHRLRVRVCYCSVYDECWWVESSLGDEDPMGEPVATKSCRSDTPSFVD